MNPLSWYSMSNWYSRYYPVTASDFRVAVPPDGTPEMFEAAGELFAAGYTASDIRNIFLLRSP